MTETTTDNSAVSEVTVDNITDSVIDDFFDNGGKFKDEDRSKASDTKTSASAKKEEPETVTEVTEDEPKAEEKKVNYGALHEERSRRKETQRKLDEALKTVEEFRAKIQQPQQAQEISYDDDPVEALRVKNQQIENFLTNQIRAQQHQSQEQQYWNRVTESENAFKQDAPDFDDAVKFLASSRTEELKDLGWGDEEVKKIIRDETRWIADKAYADEVNPAERFYNLAKRRGYNAAPLAPEKIDNFEAEQKLDTIKKGMESNRSFPPASKTVKQDLTLQQLADMNVDALSNLFGENEFDKAWKKVYGA